MRQFLIVVALCGFLFGCQKQAQEKPKQEVPKYNVLLITVDTLRADHLHCYGYDRKTTPNFDAVAREGVLYRYVIAQRGLTWPSLTSMMTSMYPHTHGVRDNGIRLDPSKITMPELLKKKGYTTGAVLRNMLNAPNRGFDSKLLLKGRNGERLATSGAVKWLKQNAGKRFFLWVHYLAPHRPYVPPPPFDTMWGKPDAERVDNELDDITLDKKKLTDAQLDQVVSLYDGEVAYVDSEIGIILDTLNGLNLKEKTLVVLSADHGEELYDHNFYFYHGCSIYDSVLQVPLIIRLPGVVPVRKRVLTTVQIVDIAPTIFDLLSLPASPTFEGKSVRKLMDAPRDVVDTTSFSEIEDKVFSIRMDHWRYIMNPANYHPQGDPYYKATDERRNGYTIAPEELYDLDNDPDETENVFKSNPEVAAQLKETLQKWVQQSKTKYQPQKMDEKTLEELKALGYVQ